MISSAAKVELRFMLNQALRFLIDTAFGFVVYAALLRFIMQWLRAPFRNPIGQAVTALTDWAVKPLRKLLPGFGGYDWASLFFAWLGQVLWLAALASLGGAEFSGTLAGYLLSLAVIELLKASLWILIGAVFIQAILSWVAPDGPLAGVLNALTFRVLAPIRRVIPPLGGSLDLSPLIVIVLAQLALILPVAWLEQSLARLFQ
ncbi:MAG TPA: YggT family protein [Casimicrobiaceae bacterium]|nr:YggT family protein [Casimicrobiaceae bacterium]